jgi:hypothetical protein
MGAQFRQLLVSAMALASPVMGAVATRQETTDSGFRFTPGPGLPSLASVGLTVEHLQNKTWVDEQLKAIPTYTPAYPEGNQDRTLSRRFDNHCNEENAETEWLRSCAAFLHALGTTPCVAGNSPVTFARIDMFGYYALVEGIAVEMIGETRSDCQHAAMAVNWAIDNCVGGCDIVFGRKICYAGGAAHAWGNDHLIVISKGDANLH